MQSQPKKPRNNDLMDASIARRQALRRLGLLATAVYAAPTVTGLSGAWAAKPDTNPPSGSDWSSQGKGKGHGSAFCPPGLPDCTTPGPGKDGAGN
jgi:hypothetical protein